MRFALKKDLAPLIAAGEAQIDTLAGICRKKYITVVPGQEMVYSQKREEAELIIANPNVDLHRVPHLAREASTLGISLLDMANAVQAKAAEWLIVSPPIEDTRLTTKAAIRAATSPAEIDALVAQAKSIFEQTS